MLSPACPWSRQLAEHLHARRHRLLRVPQPDDLHLVADLHHAALHTTRHHRPAAGNRENVLHRHQERLVDRTLRHRNVRVDRRHQIVNALALRAVVLPAPALQSLQRAPADDRDLVPGKLVLAQQLPDLQLHQLQKLRIVHHVHLVQEHHHVRNADLARQQDVLPRLRHRAVRRGYHQDRAVHLRRARDHVLDVVRVTRAVHVRVVTVLRLVLHVRRRDRDPALPLLRCLVDLVEGDEIRQPAGRQNLRDRRRQRRLPVIHVTDRPDVHVRLRTLEFLLGHVCVSLRKMEWRSIWSPRAGSNC